MNSNPPSGTVTFLFTDIEGSTRLWQEMAEGMSAANARHDAILGEAIKSNNGFIFETIGDSFHVAFHNAADAIGAALAAQRGLQAEPWGETGAIRVRMGLYTGAAKFSSDGSNKYDYHESYATIASAQRVMSVAHGGQVLISNTTQNLLQNNLPADVTLSDMGEHRLKDLRSPVHLYQLTAPDLPQDFPVITSLDALPNNLPVQLTHLAQTFGRLVMPPIPQDTQCRVASRYGKTLWDHDRNARALAGYGQGNRRAGGYIQTIKRVRRLL